MTEKLYGAWLNLGGLGDTKPLKLRYDEEQNNWWVDEGPCKDDFDFDKVGLDVKEGVVRFASYNYDEVLAFINGIRAVFSVSYMPPLEES